MAPWFRLLAAGLALSAGTGALAFPGRWEAVFAWHENVTNGERPQDVLPALQTRTTMEVRGLRSLPGGQRLLGGAALEAESWPRFDGLDHFAPRADLGWEIKPGLGLHVPVFAFEAEGRWRFAREPVRSGGEAAVRLGLRQRLASAWRLGLAYEARRFAARGPAFDQTSRQWSARVERSVLDRWTVAAEARRRFGDVTAYSQPPRPDLKVSGKPIVLVDTFAQGEPWIAYYFPARTDAVAVEVAGSWPGVVVRWRHEHRRTTHAGPGYTNRLTSLAVTFSR